MEKAMKYHQYITELSPELYLRLKHDTVLVSGTGSGKTTLIIEHAKKKADEGKTVIIAVPTRGLVQNKRASSTDDEIVYAYKKEALKSLNNGAKIIMTVYDTLVYLLKNNIFGDCTVYIDEAHKLITEAGFRKAALEGLLELRNNKRFEVILMTATPAALEDMDFKLLKVDREGEEEIKEVNYLNTGNSHPLTIARQIMDRANIESLNVYRIQNKKQIHSCITYAKSLGRNPVAIYSDGEEDSNLKIINADGQDVFHQLKQGNIAGEVTDVFGTSFIEEGLDYISGGRDVIYHLCPESGRYPSPESIVQASARVRDAKTLKINTYGQFGDSDGDEATKGLQTASYTGNTTLMLAAAEAWAEDTKNYTFEAAKNGLYQYKHKPIDRGQFYIERTKELTTSSLRPMYLIPNIKNGTIEFNYEDDKVNTIWEMLGVEQDYEKLNGEQTVAVKALYENLDDARISGIPVSLYYNGERFEERKLEKLAKVGRCFSTEDPEIYTSLRFLFKKAYSRGKILKEEYLNLSDSEQALLKTFCIEIVGVNKNRFSESSLLKNNIKVKRFKDWSIKLNDIRMPLAIPEKDW
jgi:hypothetical protein